MAVAADPTCAGTFELVTRSIIIGDGTDYAFDGAVTGLGQVEVRNNDVDKGHGDGAVTQHDFYVTRSIQIPVSIAPAPGESVTRAQIWARWRTLEAAWAKSYDVDLELIHDEVGDVSSYFGRPSGAALDDGNWRRGLPVLRVLLSFRCGDPARYWASGINTTGVSDAAVRRTTTFGATGLGAQVCPSCGHLAAHFDKNQLAYGGTSGWEDLRSRRQEGPQP
jgi:hypothetical protein